MVKALCESCANRIFRNWRTTLTGAVAAGITVAIGLVERGAISDDRIAVAAILAAIGALMRDNSEPNAS